MPTQRFVHTTVTTEPHPHDILIQPTSNTIMTSAKRLHYISLHHFPISPTALTQLCNGLALHFQASGHIKLDTSVNEIHIDTESSLHSQVLMVNQRLT